MINGQFKSPESSVFRVGIVGEENDEIIQEGSLEVKPTELVYTKELSQDKYTWPLKYLRKYGSENDTRFTIEAGKRCPNGPGLYTFSTNNAKQILSLVSRNMKNLVRSPSSSTTLSPEHTPQSTPIAPYAMFSVFSPNGHTPNGLTRGQSQSSPVTPVFGPHVMSRSLALSSRNLTENSFSVKKISDDHSVMQDGILEITDDIVYTDAQTGKKYVWPIMFLRKFGYEGKMFTIDASRRCQGGDGLFTFLCERAEEINTLVKAKQLRTISNEGNFTPSPPMLSNSHSYFTPSPSSTIARGFSSTNSTPQHSNSSLNGHQEQQLQLEEEERQQWDRQVPRRSESPVFKRTDSFLRRTLSAMDLHRNVFEVRNISDKKIEVGKGTLEVTSTDIIYIDTKTSEKWRWPLKYLRRYGCDGRIFSFEAGRRCPGGEGLYAFSTSHASDIHEAIINSVSGKNKNNSSSAINNHMIPSFSQHSLIDSSMFDGPPGGRLSHSALASHVTGAHRHSHQFNTPPALRRPQMGYGPRRDSHPLPQIPISQFADRRPRGSLSSPASDENEGASSPTSLSSGHSGGTVSPPPKPPRVGRNSPSSPTHYQVKEQQVESYKPPVRVIEHMYDVPKEVFGDNFADHKPQNQNITTTTEAIESTTTTTSADIEARYDTVDEAMANHKRSESSDLKDTNKVTENAISAASEESSPVDTSKTEKKSPKKDSKRKAKPPPPAKSKALKKLIEKKNSSAKSSPSEDKASSSPKKRKVKKGDRKSIPLPLVPSEVVNLESEVGGVPVPIDQDKISTPTIYENLKEASAKHCRPKSAAGILKTADTTSLVPQPQLRHPVTSVKSGNHHSTPPPEQLEQDSVYQNLQGLKAVRTSTTPRSNKTGSDQGTPTLLSPVSTAGSDSSFTLTDGASHMYTNMAISATDSPNVLSVPTTKEVHVPSSYTEIEFLSNPPLHSEAPTSQQPRRNTEHFTNPEGVVFGAERERSKSLFSPTSASESATVEEEVKYAPLDFKAMDAVRQLQKEHTQPGNFATLLERHDVRKKESEKSSKRKRRNS